MSCGNPHEHECTEILALSYSFVDGEIDESGSIIVIQHLSECPPCAQEVARERYMKERVQRSCACDPAPENLRVQIVTQIRSITYRSSQE